MCWQCPSLCRTSTLDIEKRNSVPLTVNALEWSVIMWTQAAVHCGVHTGWPPPSLLSQLVDSADEATALSPANKTTPAHTRNIRTCYTILVAGYSWTSVISSPTQELQWPSIRRRKPPKVSALKLGSPHWLPSSQPMWSAAVDANGGLLNRDFECLDHA